MLYDSCHRKAVSRPPGETPWHARHSTAHMAICVISMVLTAGCHKPNSEVVRPATANNGTEESALPAKVPKGALPEAILKAFVENDPDTLLAHHTMTAERFQQMLHCRERHQDTSKNRDVTTVRELAERARKQVRQSFREVYDGVQHKGFDWASASLVVVKISVDRPNGVWADYTTRASQEKASISMLLHSGKYRLILMTEDTYCVAGRRYLGAEFWVPEFGRTPE